MKKKIAVLPGDGIGKEVTAEAVKVLGVIAERFNHTFSFDYGLIGAAAIDQGGVPLPDETLTLCKNADAILLGAVGDPRYDHSLRAEIRPEQGLLKIRKELGLFANMRPVKSYPALYAFSPLKTSHLHGIDLVVFRELTGGIYFGEKKRSRNAASDLCTYTRAEIERVSILAYETAMKRSKKLTLVDKANVLETSRLWREVVGEIAKTYPAVQTDYLYVDNAAMQLMLNPRQFDVLLTENMFGDILSDEASVLTGSLGMLPSVSFGERLALYEPVHGSYPQAAGRNIANPFGSILSAALLLDYSFGLSVESALIEKAVGLALKEGMLTQDLSAGKGLSTSEAGDFIAKQVFSDVLETL
jgi:3-isopropylmalate dehydrogenase